MMRQESPALPSRADTKTKRVVRAEPKWVVYFFTVCVIAGSIWPLALIPNTPVRAAYAIVGFVNPTLLFWVTPKWPRLHRACAALTYGAAIVSLIALILYPRWAPNARDIFSGIPVSGNRDWGWELLPGVIMYVFLYYSMILAPLIELFIRPRHAEEE